MANPQRKRIRLPTTEYANSSRIFIITACTHRRERVFEDVKFAEPVFSTINDHISQRAHLIVASLLPDHVHLLMQPQADNLISVIDAWKGYTTNLVHRLGYNGPLWQVSFHDHALRRDEDVQKAGIYILENPVRLGLCKDYRQYPYSYQS